MVDESGVMSDLLLQVTTTDESCCGTSSSTMTMDQAETFAALFKAMSHPVRVKMLDIIRLAEGEICVCDIEAQFDLTQPTISHHLKLLRDAGLIASEQRGLWVYHRLRPEAFAVMQTFLAQIG